MMCDVTFITNKKIQNKKKLIELGISGDLNDIFMPWLVFKKEKKLTTNVLWLCVCVKFCIHFHC